MTVIGVLAIGGNLLMIVSVAKFSVMRRPATNQLVTALAVSDLCVGLNLPFYVSFYFDVPYVCHPYACLGRYFVALWSTMSSMLLMIAVAVDRYVSIAHPFRYPLIMSRRVSLTLIAAIYVHVTVPIRHRKLALLYSRLGLLSPPSSLHNEPSSLPVGQLSVFR